MPYGRAVQNPIEHCCFRNWFGSCPARPTRRRPGAGWKAARRSSSREETTLDEGPFFFCLKHHTVETRDGCAERHRLGPFATRSEAEHALDKVAERNERADAEDRAWNEGDR
jgi:hypothetical protein